MPFQSKAQMRAAFGGYLGPEMQAKAETWAHETRDVKHLPLHKKKAPHKEAVVRHLEHGK